MKVYVGTLKCPVMCVTLTTTGAGEWETHERLLKEWCSLFTDMFGKPTAEETETADRQITVFGYEVGKTVTVGYR